VARANVFDAQFEYDVADPEGFRAGEAKPGGETLGKAAGGQAHTVRLYEVPPGESLCPYHYEYEEEWLLILEGQATLRTPQGSDLLTTGDLVCFPPGPDGAHRLTNDGEQPARVLMFSSAREPAVAVYPDSDKIGVWPGSSEDEVMLRREDGRREYYDRET
jgi:uncharacterized cupin superfamily protein